MMDFQDAMAVLNGENGIKNMLMAEAFEDEETGHEFSQAALIADLIISQRMDVKAIADAEGVDVSIQKMTEERAAELLQGVVNGNAEPLITVFDEIEEMQMAILAEIESVESVEEHIALKQSVLHSVADGAEPVIPEIPQTEDDED